MRTPTLAMASPFLWPVLVPFVLRAPAPVNLGVDRHMEKNAVLAEIIKVLPVVVGGLLAIGGGIASQFLMHHLTGRRELKKVRRERLETLVKSVYAHEQWLDEKRTRMIFRLEEHDAPSPIDEARMLQALYFPELARKMLSIQQAHIPMLQFIHEQYLKHMQDKKLFISEWDQKPFNHQYQIYLDATNSLVEAVRSMLNEK